MGILVDLTQTKKESADLKTGQQKLPKLKHKKKKRVGKKPKQAFKSFGTISWDIMEYGTI